MAGQPMLLTIAVVLAAALAAGIAMLLRARANRIRSTADVRGGDPPPPGQATADDAPPERSLAAALPSVHPEAAPAPQPMLPAEVFSKLNTLALGKTIRPTLLTSAHDAITASTIAALGDAATQQRYSPRRPNMLPRLLSATNDERVSARDLSSIITRDPSLVGNLLRIANSSYYRVSAEPVESVDRAVLLLGTDGIRSLITSALMQPIFRVAGSPFPRFPDISWEHTFRSASACVPYNFLVEKSDPFAAELLSLLTGLAAIVVFRVAIDQYATDPRLLPEAGVIASLIESQSESVARRLGATWELSEQTLAGLDGQHSSLHQNPNPLGRSLYYGRLVGALAVLRINRVIDEETARASIPQTAMPESHVERMWTRLTAREPQK